MDRRRVGTDAAIAVAVLTGHSPAVQSVGNARQVQVAVHAVFDFQAGKLRWHRRVVITIVGQPVRADKVPHGIQGVAVVGDEPAVSALIHGFVRRVLGDHGQQ